MHHTNPAMQECIELCRKCEDECSSMLFSHCLPKGGEHAAPAHVSLMTDCIAICALAASFMVRHSASHAALCAACAAICEACAKSCEAIDDEAMQRCAELCRRCAESCRSMSKAA